MEAGGDNDLVDTKRGLKNKGIKLEEVIRRLENKEDDDLLRDDDDDDEEEEEEKIEFLEESISINVYVDGFPFYQCLFYLCSLLYCVFLSLLPFHPHY